MDRAEGISASSVVHAEDMQTDAANLEEESENLQAILENKADIHNIGFPSCSFLEPDSSGSKPVYTIVKLNNCRVSNENLLLEAESVLFCRTKRTSELKVPRRQELDFHFATPNHLEKGPGENQKVLHCGTEEARAQPRHAKHRKRHQPRASGTQ